MKFEYRVRDQKGFMQAGILEAEHKNRVAEKLLGQGYYIVLLREVDPIRKLMQYDIKLDSLRKVNSRDLVVFTQQLAAMLKAGLPIIRCFKILSEQTANPKLRSAVLKIKQDLEAGLALWEAMANHPGIFTGIYISMIRAGEMSGKLESILERLSNHLQREQEITSKVKMASIYPMIISLLAVLVVLFIITFVMPTFISMFQSSGINLPLPTRILLGTSSLIKSRGIFIILGIVLLAAILNRAGKTSKGRLIFDSLYLSIPIIGKITGRIAVARFAHTMGTLVKSGIPVLQALEAMEEVAGNAVISRAISKACASIKEGESITKPLEEAGVFEPMVTQMIAVGEETGSLDDVLIRMSDYYESELTYNVNILMSILEPILILLVAALVGGVIIATLLPMFDLVNIIET